MTVEVGGVLKPGHLALAGGNSVRESLVGAFSAILAHAREQDAAADPPHAVHEYRKAVRRARSLLRLFEGLLGVEAYASLSGTLREVHRATSGVRDRQVVLDILDSLDDELNDHGAAAVVEPLRTSVRAIAAPSAADIIMLLDRGAAQLTPLPGLLAAALPGKIKWRALADGLADTYRRTRRRLRAARRDGSDEAVHGFRKRVKELTYQVELFSGNAGKRSRKIRKRLGNLAELLGGVADLMIVRAYVDKHLGPGQQRDQIIELLERARVQRLAAAFASADRVLDDSPRQFARKIVKSARKARLTG